jgi:hypothetical protein
LPALEALYGSEADNGMPLAIPFGAFAAAPPNDSTIHNWLVENFAQSEASEVPSRFATLAMPTPSIPVGSGTSQGAVQRTPASSGSTASWSIPDASRVEYRSGSAFAADDAETEDWADLIADAVSDDRASPALALAGEETGGGSESSSGEPDQSQDAGETAAGPELDDLAESVFEILRRRLVLERERDFA